jgi:uroporphyrinogen-III synthase
VSETRPFLIVARSEPTDDDLIRAAEAEGCDVARLELFETRPGGQVDALAERLKKVEPGTAVAWTSRRAAAVLARTALPSRRATLESVPLFAVGDESAAPFRAEGLAVSVPSSGIGAGHLAGHLIEHARALGLKRVLFLHGDRALPDFPDALTRAGIPVEKFEVYRTAYLPADPTPVIRALDAKRPCVVTYFSPSGIAGLERLLDPDTGETLHADAVALARGETTYQALLRWGYAHAARPVGGKHDSFSAFVLDTIQSVARSPH